MAYMQWYIALLLATFVLADFYIDNANTSVVYSMAPIQSGGQSWETFSVSTQSLELSITNSTGNYTILLDASHCYDQNYALGVCGDGDNCFVQIPFIGSGITMYVFNAGASGMTASFSVDGSPAVSSSIDTPPGPTFQVSNVSLYNIQGLTSGNHTMVMTILDWDGSPTSMKFDYAYVNESFVAAPATTSSTSSTTSTSGTQTASQTSTGNSSSSNKVNIGAVVGGTVGGVIALATAVIAIFCFCKRRSRHQDVPPPESPFQVNPFISEYHSSPTPPLFTQPAETNPSVPPLTRSAILRDALAAGTHASPELGLSSQSIRSGVSSAALQPVRYVPSPSDDPHMPSSTSRLAHAGSPFLDAPARQQHNLTDSELEAIERLRADNVPVETIARVIEGFMSSRHSTGGADGRKGAVSHQPEGSIFSALPPPSYQTQDR